MMRRKLLHRMKEVCGATTHMIKDKLIAVEYQVDGTRLLIYIYIQYLYIDFVVFAILASQYADYQPVHTFFIAS